MMQRKIVMASLCALLVLAGLTSCGKRGDPYRPSEIPAQQTNSSRARPQSPAPHHPNRGTLTCLHSTAMPTTI